MSKNLVFVPAASAHKDCLVLTSNTQWPEIQPIMSQGQIVSAKLLLGRTYRQTTTILV